MTGPLLILSVNVGLPRAIGTSRGETVMSGIAKEPVAGEEVVVRETNIDGDGQAALSVHGGLDKVIYAYPSDHWAWWEATHGFSCRPATFGENITLQGAGESDVAIGDRFRWGDVLVEISQPRAPCFKFAMHTGRENAPLQMTTSARCGWYLRVLQVGPAPTKDAKLERVFASDGPSVRDAFIAAMHRSPRDLCLRVHDAPALADAWRRTVARKLGQIRD
jgi:MOSC domain-containing protein YiiM